MSTPNNLLAEDKCKITALTPEQGTNSSSFCDTSRNLRHPPSTMREPREIYSRLQEADTVV